MSIVLGVAIGVVSIFIIISLVRKIMRFVFLGSIFLVLLGFGSYLFLYGDGRLSQEYLPNVAHENLQDIRSEARDKVENKAVQLKDKAIEKATTTTRQVTETVKNNVQQGVQNKVDGTIDNRNDNSKEEVVIDEQ